MANGLKTALLLGLLSGLLLVIGEVAGGANGLMIAFVFAGVMNFVSYWFSDKIVLRMYKAQEVGPGHPLYQVTERLARQAGLPIPKVYVIPDDSPNAFATGRNPQHAAVAATEGILKVLNQAELEGVIAHELAHVKHRDILITTVAATIGGAISFLGNMYMWNSMFGNHNRDEEDSSPLSAIVGLLVMILGPIAAAVIQMSISRQREYAADTEGARLSGDPMYLASALQKIHHAADRIPMEVNPAFNALMIAEPRSMGQRMAELFSTHPPLEKRMMNLIGRESL